MKNFDVISFLFFAALGIIIVGLVVISNGLIVSNYSSEIFLIGFLIGFLAYLVKQLIFLKTFQ